MDQLVASCNSTAQKSFSSRSRNSAHLMELAHSVTKHMEEGWDIELGVVPSRPFFGGVRSAVS